jgi:hypothetical protein
MKTPKNKATTSARSRRTISARRLREMIEEATVDAYDQTEQAVGWFTMFENYLELPFETEVLGVRVKVERIEQRDDNQIVAICRRGQERLAIGIADLPLSSPRPEAAEWIDAYRAWLRGTG